MSFDSILDKLKNERGALSSILIIIGILLLAMVVGNTIAAVFMILIGGIGVDDLTDINGALMSSSSGWWALMIGQGVASILTFILAVIFYWKVVEKKNLDELNFESVNNLKVFGLVILTQLCFLPLNSWFQEINAAMQLPEALSGVEKFMKSMEDSLAEMTEYLTQFDTLPKVIVGFIVIAVVAGIGEELIFRGLIQRKLYKGLKNPHTAIWLAAFIFSAIHFQFYGFLPRLFLGAMFGYFFLWTGNLWVPIVAHIFNNGFAVVMYYLANTQVMDAEVAEMEHFPTSVVLVSFVLTAGMLFLFKKSTDESKTPSVT
ncbi:CPBP family intramembrane glutamic endopeptidase [Jiulongibacter sediminis]|jgi:membrane protease YdiL (CAAX protease family)|uniref:CPBP family intramembrane glutamic endopeptidase n=1 Tax=Jiulongibacter sediminis TaxID=1605367 RepID=UPI0026F2BE56|nr:CPBP family intramembrane glutamic endopeptidase [Jiulongibacter sediminis]